jgi:hypothetical protein
VHARVPGEVVVAGRVLLREYASACPVSSRMNWRRA